MVQIKNPTNNLLEITIAGVDYQVAPNGVLDGVSLDVALAWKKVHEFIQVSEVSQKKVDEKPADVATEKLPVTKKASSK